MLGKDSRFVEGYVFGMWQTNCIVLGDRELGTCVVVDPGQDAAQPVAERLRQQDLRCEAILLTHGHLDHLWAVPELAKELDCPVLLHPEDRWLWDDPVGGLMSVPPDVIEQQLGFRWDPPHERLEEIRDGQTLSFAGFPLTVRHTPGHTPGSSVFLLTDTGEDDPLLLSGDLIFAGSVGRTDLPRGSWDQLLASIHQVVLPLPDATVILPGHGPQTTVG
ncbi:MAG TPA: MBL fold metallo-hydrolase, partial [Egibacteraceae bacterium]|nr:MBL fold metallo-hydrolase [Egibacteraceae bacterium]